MRPGRLPGDNGFITDAEEAFREAYEERLLNYSTLAEVTDGRLTRTERTLCEGLLASLAERAADYTEQEQARERIAELPLVELDDRYTFTIGEQAMFDQLLTSLIDRAVEERADARDL